MYLISDLLKAYLNDKDLKASTRQSYGVACRALIRQIGDCIVEEIDRNTVTQWRKNVLRITLKEVSWNTYMRHLRGLYQFGLDVGLIGLTKNPFDDSSVRCPKRPKKTVEQETIDNAQRMLAAAEHEENHRRKYSDFYPAWFWSTVFDTLLLTGIRAGELMSLRAQDIDLKNGEILVAAETSKGLEQRLIPIHGKLVQPLTRLLDYSKDKKIPSHLQLFNINAYSTRHRKDIMDTDQLESFYKRMSDKLGVKVSPHRFRHTLASSLMREHERNVHTVKELLGHKHLSTTLQYVSVNLDQMRSLLNEFR